jgi:hypothetical protein
MSGYLIPVKGKPNRNNQSLQRYGRDKGLAKIQNWFVRVLTQYYQKHGQQFQCVRLAFDF